MVKKLAIIREIFKGDHNAAAGAVARKVRRNQISALSGMLNYEVAHLHPITNVLIKYQLTPYRF